MGALLLAAGLGFGAATALADQRLRTLGEGEHGVLSLDSDAAFLEPAHDLVPAADGTPAVVVSVTLINTGPRPVALEEASIPGTGFRAEDVSGRRLPEGKRTVVRLLRPVRCDEVDVQRRAGALRVRATTGAGPRTVDLRIDAQGLGFAAEVMRSACGLSPPTQALVARDGSPAEVSGRQARVTTELSNASAAPILVTSVQVSSGLRLVGVEGASGEPVALPLRLPAGDYDPPVEQFRGRGPARILTFVVEMTDCEALPRTGTQDEFFPLFEATVTGLPGAEELPDLGFHGGGPAWGDSRLVERLRAAACPPARESQLAPIPPLADPARLRTQQELRWF